MIQSERHSRFMNEALTLARLSLSLGEVPVGCVVVRDGQIIGRGYNRRELLGSCLGHAELGALDEASKKCGNWRLIGATVYCTLEPCIMCSGALLHSRISTLVFGASDTKFGGIKSLYNLSQDQRINHRFDYIFGVLEPQCADLLRNFFKKLRAKQ